MGLLGLETGKPKKFEMLIEWEMVGETQICKRKTNSRYLFLPFKSIKCSYVMQLRYELFTINLSYWSGRPSHAFFLIAFLKELCDLFCRMATGIEFQVNGPRYFKDCLVNSILQNRGN